MLKILEALHCNRFIIFISFVTVTFITKAQIKVYDTLNIITLKLPKINSKDYSEYAPFKYKNTLYYISDKENDLIYHNTDKETDKVFSSLYQAKMKDSISPVVKNNTVNEIDSKFYVGPFCKTASGSYYTSTNSSIKNKKAKMSLQINYLKSDSIAGTPTKLSFGLNDTISCVHPTVLGDTLIVFASDLQEGEGKVDLFYSIKKNNEWQKPINCGPKVNSKYNESFPSLINGRLYFSSDRPNGFGGLDIYYIDWFKKDDELKLMPSPINSAFDDFGVSIDSTFKTGYFSSNKNGTDDIYYFKNKFPNFKNLVEMKNNHYCFTFFEEDGLSSKDTSGLEYEWSFGGTIKKRGVEVKHCFEKEGKYIVKLDVVEKNSGEVFYNQLSYTFDLITEKQLFIHSPDSAKTGTELEFDPSYSNIEGFVMIDFYWDFGDYTYSYIKKPKHIFTQNGTYIVKLGVDGLLNNKKVSFSVYKTIVLQDYITEPIFKFNLPK